jgi:hypothetical protein
MAKTRRLPDNDVPTVLEANLMKSPLVRCSMMVFAGSLLLLLKLESGNAEPPKKTPIQMMKNSPLVLAASLISKNQELPAIIAGECRKYTDQHREAYLDKDAKQLECNLVQNRFVPSKEGIYDLFVDVFRQTFRRSSDTGQWVSRNGPDGMCGTVDVTTLEINPNSPDLVLTYSSLQIHTNRVNLLCKDFPNEERETFSWKNPLTNPPMTLRSNKINQMIVAFRSGPEKSQKTKLE